MTIAQICEKASNEIVIQIELDGNNPSAEQERKQARAEVGMEGDSQQPTSKRSRGSEQYSVGFSKSYKPFWELSVKQKKRITQPLVEMLETFINVNDFDLDVSQLLGYLVCRQNMNNKEVVQIGEDLLNESVTDKHKASFTDIEAVAFVHSLDLSKEQTRRVRQLLAAKKIDFPPTNNLLPVRKSLHPVSHPILNGKGRSVDFAETVKSIAALLIKVLNEINPNFAPTAGRMVFYGKDGGDEAGSMPRLKSKKAAEDEEHIFHSLKDHPDVRPR